MVLPSNSVVRPIRFWVILVLTSISLKGLCDEQTDLWKADAATGRPAEKEKIALAVTVAGGVSLGAYQAGYLYYLTEVVKQNPDLFEFKLLTGASAGLINAVITLLSVGDPAGEESTLDPSRSLFYRVWNEMTHDELLDVEDAPPGALSSRKVLDRLADLMEDAWERGLSSDLDMVVGASTTRLGTRTVRVGQGFDAKTLEEKFVFRVRGEGSGRPPRVTNYVNMFEGLENPFLPFGEPAARNGDHNANFAIIRQILFASAAIPVVFLPQRIDYCMTSPDLDLPHDTRVRTTCHKPSFSELFIDGGIVDRQPLRLAHRLAKSGLEGTPEGVVWREVPANPTGSEPPIYYLYLDPRSPTFPNSIQDEELVLIEQTGRLFRSLSHLFKGVFRSVQSKELYTLVDENPEIRKRIQMASHDFPALGGLLANFFGFFDRELRRFDFYLGMRDAHHFMVKRVAERLRERFGRNPPKPVLPDASAIRQGPAGYGGTWRPYFCLRATLDGRTELGGACEVDTLKDFLILAQVTLDRLYDHCRRFPYDPGLDNDHCKAAMAGASPPRVPHVKEAPGTTWQRLDEDDENSFTHTMRLLDIYGFRFRDLGLDRSDAAYGLSKIRAELLHYMDSFADKLRYRDALALRILGKPAINLLAYAPPEGIIYLVMGTGGELSVSATLGRLEWLRFNFGLQSKGFNLFLASAPNAFTLTPLIGLELEPVPLSIPLLQSRIGVRIGYQFSTADRFLADACDYREFERNTLKCSAPVVQAFLALVFYERVRVQLGFEWFPKWLPPMREFEKHRFNGLVEVGWQWISPF